MSLSPEQLERYHRNILLDDIGPEGQDKWLKGKVLIIGIGGLGSPAALYLAAAGIGTLGLADNDQVQRGNLQRQIIHSTENIGAAKVVSAQERIKALNPDIHIVTFPEYVSENNIKSLIQGYDFIIDATDNFSSKFLINDACVREGKPFVHGGILGMEGQLLTHVPGQACLRCLFEDVPEKGAIPDPAQTGVLGVVPGVMGTLQAAEALKFISGARHLLLNRLLIFNVWTATFRSVTVQKNPTCPVCATRS